MKDSAFLVYGHELFGDENVMAMSFEQRGVYVFLLWTAWVNRGLPADLDLLARMLGLTKKRFARIWPGIAPCWTEVEGRLYQKRQEAERSKREESRRSRPEESDAAAVQAPSRSDRMRAVAQARWGKRNAPRIAGDAHAHAHADAPRNADAHAARNASAHLPPAPPSVQDEVHPKARDASAHAQTHAHPASPRAAEGASSRTAEGAPNPAATRAKDDGKSPVAELTEALLATPYRAGVGAGNAIRRRAHVRDRAQELCATGLDPAAVIRLAQLAVEKSNAADSGGLLAHWLDANQWREVLDEQASKQKQHQQQRRASVARASSAEDPLAGGVYGETTETAAAGDLVGQVLAAAQTKVTA